MWTIKTFKTKQAMGLWLEKMGSKIQWQEVFINNGYAIEYRRLKVIDIQ